MSLCTSKCLSCSYLQLKADHFPSINPNGLFLGSQSPYSGLATPRSVGRLPLYLEVARWSHDTQMPPEVEWAAFCSGSKGPLKLVARAAAWWPLCLHGKRSSQKWLHRCGPYESCGGRRTVGRWGKEQIKPGEDTEHCGGLLLLLLVSAVLGVEPGAFTLSYITRF